MTHFDELNITLLIYLTFFIAEVLHIPGYDAKPIENIMGRINPRKEKENHSEKLIKF